MEKPVPTTGARGTVSATFPWLGRNTVAAFPSKVFRLCKLPGQWENFIQASLQTRYSDMCVQGWMRAGSQPWKFSELDLKPYPSTVPAPWKAVGRRLEGRSLKERKAQADLGVHFQALLGVHFQALLGVHFQALLDSAVCRYLGILSYWFLH